VTIPVNIAWRRLRAAALSTLDRGLTRPGARGLSGAVYMERYISADREGGLRAVFAGLTDASEVSRWAIPRCSPSKRDGKIPVAFAKEHHVVCVGLTNRLQHEASLAVFLELDALRSHALLGHGHEGRSERPPLKWELDDDLLGVADIWRWCGRKVVGAHVAEAVTPGAQIPRSILVANCDRWRCIEVFTGTISARGKQERTHEDRPGQARVLHSLAHNLRR
jgi:hypothetical protein